MNCTKAARKEHARERNCDISATTDEFRTYVIDSKNRQTYAQALGFRVFYFMMTGRRRKVCSTRAVIAAIVACLSLFQGLAFDASRNAVANSEQSGLHAAVGERCNADAQTGDTSPSPAHACHSQCCIIGSQGGRDVSPLFVAVAFVVAIYSAPEPNGSVVRPPFDELGKSSSGWASSWSSRAPPVFS